MGVVRNVKFGLYVNGSKSQPADVVIPKGAWPGSRDILEFYTPKILKDLLAAAVRRRR